MKKIIMDLSIVLPVFNEEDNIINVIEEIVAFMDTTTIDYEIIAVNDGSKDNTGKILINVASKYPQIKIVTHRKNKGYGRTLRDGFSKASKHWTFFLDSDSQFDFSEIGKFIEVARRGESEFIIGYRKKRQDPYHRLLNAKLFGLAIHVLFGLHAHDIDAAFKLMRTDAIRNISLQSDSALINAETLIKAKRLGYTIVELPVTHYARKAGNPTGAKLSVVMKAICDLVKFRVTGNI